MWTNAIRATNCIIKATNNSSGLGAISSCLSTISKNKSGCNASYVTFVGYRKDSLFWVKGYVTVSTLIFWHVLSLDYLWTTGCGSVQWMNAFTNSRRSRLLNETQNLTGFCIPHREFGTIFLFKLFFPKMESTSSSRNWWSQHVHNGRMDFTLSPPSKRNTQET